MARCPDCLKFVSMETQEPECENPEVTDEGAVTAEVRLVRACADCGTELKEASFSLEAEHDQANSHLSDLECETCQGTGALGAAGPDSAGSPCRPCDGTGFSDKQRHAYDIKETSTEATERTEGKGRGTRSFYGVKLEYTITCACGATFDGSLEDEIQASSMDDLT